MLQFSVVSTWRAGPEQIKLNTIIVMKITCQESAQRQSYVNGVGLEWLVTVARFMQRRDCIEEGILLRLRLPLT